MTLKLSSAIGMALMLAACAGGTKNRGLESVHQPVVQRTDYVIDVATAGYGRGLMGPEARTQLERLEQAAPARPGAPLARTG